MFDEYIIRQINHKDTEFIKSFECQDADLNDFLINEAGDYQDELLAATYLVIDSSNKHLCAYFSLLNDTIRFNENEKSKWNKLNRRIPNSKRRKQYPAIKLGRLAVSKHYANRGLGRYIINYAAASFLSSRRSGCRFMTVDAYKGALGFYEKCGFTYFTDKDKDEYTRVMYIDLKTLLQ